ncbi:MAG TPA: chromate transporter [Xanthobacteraceae bacterium]|nr:chromate transporter [Xanthobacteraceae bacterium]
MGNERASRVAGTGPLLRRIGLLKLFLLFCELGLSSFGGSVSAWMHRDFVQRRRLIGETEFIAAMALCRIMPGATVANLAVVIGRRLHGAAGAATAVLGLLLGPCLAIVGFALLYRRYAGAAGLHIVLEGAAAASVGLMIAMGVSLGGHIVGVGTRSTPGAARKAGAVAVVAATFVLIGILRFPMVPVVLVLTPLSVALAYFAPMAPRSVGAADAGG